MRSFILYSVFFLLTFFCFGTWYLHQHRGNVVFLRGEARQRVQPIADFWYKETKIIREYYHEQCKACKKELKDGWDKSKNKMGLSGCKTIDQHYTQMTNTIFQSMRTKINK